MNLNEHTIWICWYQGIQNLNTHAKNSACYNSWINYSEHNNIVLLHDDNIKEYAPEYYDIITSSPYRRIQAKSDLLRLILLEKYGGTWIDASVYCNKKFEEIYLNTMNDSNFFAYRYIPRSINIKGNKEVASWYISNNTINSYIIKAWKTKFLKRYMHDKNWKLFTIHETLCELYDTDINIKNTLNDMIQLNQTAPHSASKGKKCEHSYVYKRPNIYHINAWNNIK